MPRFIEKGTKTPEDTAFLMGTNADGVDGKYSQAALKHYFIDEEVEARKKADEEEKAAREAADTALGGRIDAEATARKKADEEEKAAREAADTALGSRIDAEATARANGDAASAAAAATAQSTADSAASAIAAEQTARANADSAINTKIGDLGSLTTSAKGTLVAAINEAAKSGGSANVPMGTSAVAGIVRITDNSGSQSTAADSIAISPKAVTENYAPKNHASTSKDFGIATSARFGHVKLTDDPASTGAENTGYDGLVPSIKATNQLYHVLYDTRNRLIDFDDIEKYFLTKAKIETDDVDLYGYDYVGPSNSLVRGVYAIVANSSKINIKNGGTLGGRLFLAFKCNNSSFSKDYGSKGRCLYFSGGASLVAAGTLPATSSANISVTVGTRYIIVVF